MQNLRNVQAALLSLVQEQTHQISFTPSLHAPETWQALQEGKNAGLVVYARACDTAMDGTPYGNMQFRAWHDSIHLAVNADFSMGTDQQKRGEWHVAREQCRIAEKRGTALANWLWADLRSQEAYDLAHGAFPENQIECVVDDYNLTFNRYPSLGSCAAPHISGKDHPCTPHTSP